MSPLDVCLSWGCAYRETRSHIVTAAVECQELSNVAAGVCQDAVIEGESLVNSSQDCEQNMRNFGNIKELGIMEETLKGDQTQRAVSVCSDMDSKARKVLELAEGLTESLSRAIDSIPEELRETYEQQESEDVYTALDSDGARSATEAQLGPEYREILELMQVDEDIVELERSQNTTRGLNLLSSATVGTETFEKVRSKGEKAKQLFSQMMQVCKSLGQLTATLALDSNCCARFRAILTSIGSLFKCRNLALLLSRAAQAAMRLVKAIGEILKRTWQSVQGFLGEFRAAMKIGSFVQNSVSFVSNNLPGKLFGGGGTSRS